MSNVPVIDLCQAAKIVSLFVIYYAIWYVYDIVPDNYRPLEHVDIHMN